ncbi:MAG: LETM1-like protein-domain-containing protein [Podila humilis]|nr:MAG: LETM1-like protein-domain-containing protein [Podila humilis]
MIPFGLVFLLATEYIPLIIIFAPQLIPTTCVTPSQLEGRRKKIHEKRSVMTEKLIRLNRREITKESLANYNSFMTISKKYGEAFDYEMIDREHLSSFCKFMGLNGFGPKFMLKKRLGKHMDYIRNDDELLQQEGIDGLSFSELQLANEERGMRSLEVSKEHLEKSLAYWLKLSVSKDSTVPPALLVFSRMFLLHSTFKSDTKK